MVNMVFSISLNEVLIFLFCVAGISLLVYLCIAASNINGILRDVKYLFDKNKDNIDNTISSLPDIADNIKSITGEVREGVQVVAATAESIEKNIANSSRSIAGKTEIAVDYVRVLSEVIKTGLSYLKKRK